MLRTVCVLSALFVLSHPVHAQLWSNPYTGTVWNNPTSSLISTMVTNNMYEQALKDAGAPQQTAQPHEPWSKTDFTPGKRRLVVDTIIAGLTANVDQQKQIGAGIDKIFAAYEQRARKNNVAWAMAFVAAVAVLVDKGVSMTDQQTQNLATVFNDRLARTPAFQSVGAADRQKLYETFVTLGGLMALFNEVGKTDRASAAAAKALAKQTFAMLMGSH